MFRMQRLHHLRSEFTRTLGTIIHERGFRELQLQFHILDRPEFFRLSENLISTMVPVPDSGHYRSLDVDLKLQGDVRTYRDIIKERSEQLKTAAWMYRDRPEISSKRAVAYVRMELSCHKRCKTERDAMFRMLMCCEALSYVCELEHEPQFQDLLDQACRGDDIEHIREEVVRICGRQPVYPFLDLPYRYEL